MIEKLKSHPNYGFNEQDNGRKLNEVIDELNRREEVPTDTTVACSDCNTNAHTFLCCPERYPRESAKREETSTILPYKTFGRDDYVLVEDVRSLQHKAVEAYKKRLVEKFEQEHDYRGVNEAIKLVNETF